MLKIKDTSYSYLTITGILNSSLIGWYFRKKFQISDDDTFPQIMIRDILEFPIPDLEKNQDQEISNNVKTIINLNNELAKTKLQSKIEQLKTKLDFYEEKLNKIIFKVYGVNDTEKKIVEGDV